MILCSLFLCACTPTGEKRILMDDGAELFIDSGDTDIVNFAIEEFVLQIRYRPSETDIPYKIITKAEADEIIHSTDFTKSLRSYVTIEHGDKDVFAYLRPFNKEVESEFMDNAEYWLYIREPMDANSGITTSTLDLYDDYRFNILDEFLYLTQK